MKHILFLIAAVLACAATPVCAAWYWPFGSDEDSPDRPPRLHRLLENANDLIEQAEDASLDGDAEKALELYNAALTNLVDIAAKNPDRAEKPEFAPLRNKIAATSAAIDSIRFAQVNQNIRAVAVTDTTELQKKYDAEQAKKKGIDKVVERRGETKDDNDGKDKKKGLNEEPKSGDATSSTAKTPNPSTNPPIKQSNNQTLKQSTNPPINQSPNQTIKQSNTQTIKQSPTQPPNVAGFDEKIQTAIKELQAKDYAAADLLLEDMEKERRNDLNVLILRAAAQSGLKYYLAARRTLEKAQRAHPKSYLPCYNLAYLMFKLEGEGPESARQYYELGRTLGGPQDAKLESLLK